MITKTPVTTRNLGIIKGQNKSAPAVIATPRSADAHRERMNAMGTIRIPLHSRKYPNLFTLIDEEDADLVSQYRWYPLVMKHTTYAVGNQGTRRIFLHRLLLDAPKNVLVDHADHDGLNNSRSNIRLCTPSENLRNQKSPRNATGYFGVYYHKKSQKYQAQIHIQGRNLSCGLHDTPEAAARARDEAACEHYGEFVSLNFPREVAA